ncbi:hypothetical protein EK904_003436 [Melospiza melodia maxima]|nr:hypothetical protein EK904_003436 [Melospiza melodia maxima]
MGGCGGRQGGRSGCGVTVLQR